jgi:hypothetical protein
VVELHFFQEYGPGGNNAVKNPKLSILFDIILNKT